MPALTLYLDNSVVGGYFDPEFEQATQLLWARAELGHFRFAASVVTQQEASVAPPHVVRLFAQTFPDSSTLLPLDDRAEELARAYMQAGVVTVKYIDDARHVAIAVTHGIGLIVSWNFKHLANYQREYRILIASIWCMVFPVFESSAQVSLSMETTTKTFDAVAESRQWKETVALETEGMTRDQVVAYFNGDAVQRRFLAALARSSQDTVAK